MQMNLQPPLGRGEETASFHVNAVRAWHAPPTGVSAGI